MSRVTINVNGLSLIHEDSGGLSTATLPDVCITPPTFAPVPYPNVARSRDLVSGSSFVRADGGNRIAVAGSAFGRSVGDEPGAGGGVTSGVRGKEATFLTHSFDVLIEGRGACRLTDKMLHNRGNTIDCAGAHNPPVAHSNDSSAGGGKKKGARNPPPKPPPLWETPQHPKRLGVDTNCTTLDTAYTKKRNRNFVARYLGGISPPQTVPPSFPPPAPPQAFFREEAHRLSKAKLDLVAIWEVTATGAGPSSRAVEALTPDKQHFLGHFDGKLADHYLSLAGGGGNPIYFTVDFHVTPKVWRTEVLDPTTGLPVVDVATGKPVTNGALIVKYFEGINAAIGIPRTGVYGTYETVRQLFERKLVRYGWQMTFKHDPYPKAQIRQYSIYPDLTRWGPDLFKFPESSPERAAAFKAWSDGLKRTWNIEGAGGLDFDCAVMQDFGQWQPNKK